MEKYLNKNIESVQQLRIILHQSNSTTTSRVSIEENKRKIIETTEVTRLQNGYQIIPS